MYYDFNFFKCKILFYPQVGIIIVICNCICEFVMKVIRIILYECLFLYYLIESIFIVLNELFFGL
jgi:hypothetical protein